MKNGTVKTAERRIGKWDFIRVFLRSFFIQSVWNYRSLISVGFGSCLIPIVRKFYPTPESRQEFFKRHFRFFNAHPYLVSYALGVAIRLEQEASAGEVEAGERLEKLKDLLVSILGAVGDKLFWYTIKPAALITGVVGAMLAPTMPAKLMVLGAVFLLYNIPHIYLRYRGILEGYEAGLEIYKHLDQKRFERLQRMYFTIESVSYFILLFFLIFNFARQEIFQVFYFVASMGLTLILRRWIQNFYIVCLFTLIILLGSTFIWQ